MASIMLETNGAPKEKLEQRDVKIIVVGDPKCGKTELIKKFYEKNNAGEIYVHEGCPVYPCKYEFKEDERTYKIYEVPSLTDDAAKLIKPHSDTNCFVLMYAIDDPSSFENVKYEWYLALNEGSVWDRGEPVVLVGTKRDLRGNQETIERLRRVNQFPVTEAQGVSLKNELEKVGFFFECSAVEPHNVDEAFHDILNAAFGDYRNDPGSNVS